MIKKCLIVSMPVCGGFQWTIKMLLRRERLTALRASHFHDTKEWRQLVDSFTKETIEGEVARYHRNCGSHSNIPPCCVEFYIRYWWGRVPLSWIGRIYRFLKSPLYPSDKIPAYVPCPKCLLNWRLHINAFVYRLFEICRCGGM